MKGGCVQVPPSKSAAHRLIICAAMAQGRSVIENIAPSKDISATANAMNALGADVRLENGCAVVNGISNIPEKAEIDCCESGSTLRFLIPAAAALGTQCVFSGRGKLPERPITPYLSALPSHGVEFDYHNTMPFGIKGKLTSGVFRISGNISSQFITGLLLALPLIEGDSEVLLTSPLESKPYVDITLGCMEKFGVKVEEKADGSGYHIPGGQKYRACNCRTEGDYSNAAFFEVANCLGADIDIRGLDENSYQGDKKIVEICRDIVYNNNGGLEPFELDCSDIPDLVPVLAVLASFCRGRSKIYNVARLRIKECDRLHAMAQNLNALGGRVCEYDDRLVIDGVESLNGGEADAHNDHRIAMAMAVAAARCTAPLVIKGAQCVEKSYPDFWERFAQLGGEFETAD